MIFKKPYAFLIKNFKKVHILLAVAMAFVIYKTFSIYSYFKDSADNNYYASLAYEQRNFYVNFFVILIIIFIIFLFVSIYYLLNHKKKPRRFYMYSIGFYAILLIYYFVMSGVFKGLLQQSLEMQAIRAHKDVAFMLIFPQVALFIYAIITAIGINLKKFNFAADLAELDINEADNEEVELEFKFEDYKAKRAARRNVREFKYYVKENMFVITCIGAVLGGILGIFVIRAIIKSGGNLLANQAAINNKFTIKVQDSIISNLRPNGEVIGSDYYLVVKLYLKNISNTTVALDYSNYRLVYKKKSLTPDLTASQYFYDYAFPYLGDELKPKEERTIALAYKLKRSEINNSFLLKIYKGSNTDKKKMTSNYNEVKLKPKKQMDIGDAKRVAINEQLSFENSNVGKTTLTVKSFTFMSSYVYTYEVCDENICNPTTAVITPDYSTSHKSAYLMQLEYDFSLDKDSIYSKYDSNFSSFVTNYMKVKYVVNGQTYYSNATSRTPSGMTGIELIQVDKDIINADEIQLVFTIRNRNHIIVLK